MNQEKLLREISRLPLRQRVEIAIALLDSVREEEEGAESEARDSQEKLAARLRGVLEFEGSPPTDEEVKIMIADYLVEKYS